MAHAQTVNDPAAVERTIPKRMTSPEAATRVELPKTKAANEADVAGEFVLGAVHISGATVFTPAELSTEFEPFLATPVNGEGLKAIATRITGRYRSAGFLLSYATLPAQRLSSGIVRIDVIEGHIDGVTVEGAGSKEDAIARIAAPLLKPGPLNSRTLERIVGLIRDLPGVAVTDIRVSRSATNPASHHLTIVVTRDRFEALAYADNRGTEKAGRERFYVSATANSLITAGDMLSVDLFAIPGNGYHYYYGQASASVPIGSNGWRFGVSASRGNQYQTYSFGKLDGESTNFSAKISYPIIRSRKFTVLAKASANDWRTLDDFNAARFQRDHLRVGRVSFDIVSAGKGRIEAQLAFARGFAFDGVTRRGDPLASRSDGSGIFSKASAAFQVARPLSKRFTLRANFAGQYASRPLLSAEEFSIGGSAIGRAYDFNTLTGDHGIAAGVEAGYRIGGVKDGPQQVELFGYSDGGAVFQSGRQSGQPRHQTLSSAGVGARFILAGFSLSAEVGVPLVRVDGTKSVRGFVSIARGF